MSRMRTLIDHIAPDDRIVNARLRIVDDCYLPPYAFKVYYAREFSAETDYRYFETRDQRNAAILAMCDASEREGFTLRIS